MKTVKTILIGIVWCVLLAGCVTSVDEALPYDQLPEITVATQFNLVASPSHPTAYLSSDKISAGEKVRVIGTDKNAAWLLVLHDNLLGWMPTFFSATNIATLKPAVVVESLSDKCTKYLGATFAPDEAWISNGSGAVFVIGSIYRAQTEIPFEEAALDIEIEGGGAVAASDYVHTPLTGSSAVVLFGFSVAGLQKDSQIRFTLKNSSNESLSFQAAFFSNDCSEKMDHLPIGKTKVALARQGVVPQDAALAPTQQASASTPTPAIILKESGAQLPTHTPQFPTNMPNPPTITVTPRVIAPEIDITDYPKWLQQLFTNPVIPGSEAAGVKLGDTEQRVMDVLGPATKDFYQIRDNSGVDLAYTGWWEYLNFRLIIKTELNTRRVKTIWISDSDLNRKRLIPAFEEISIGSTKDDVLQKLGTPRVIARLCTFFEH